MVITPIFSFFKTSLQMTVFSLLTLSYLSSVAHAMEDKDDDNSISSPSYLLAPYGGEKGNSLFQEESKKAIQSIRQAFKFYRENPTTRKKDTLRNLTLRIANKRADIAKKTGSKNEKDFSIFRMTSESEYATTPLFPDNYKEMRHFLQERLVSLLSQPATNQWVLDGSTRYRLRVMEPKDWPTTCKAKDFKLYQSALAEGVILKEGPVKIATDNILDMNYFKDFVMKGNVYNSKDNNFFWYSSDLQELAIKNLDKSEILKRHRTLDVVMEDWKNLDLSLLIEQRLIEQRHLNSPDKARLVRVDIEHKINDKYVPGYGLIGLIPNYDEIVAHDISLMLCHPGKVYLSPLVEHYEELLEAAILADSQSTKEILEKVGLFHDFWLITMPFVRGGATDGEWIAEALYESHGYTHEIDKIQAPSNASFMYWSIREFLENYTKAVKLKPVSLNT